ncbi:hypothetical protein TNCV_48741 [Trichonephila clavipes]|nr:hypothetical protein TNCV_48741 [Trichonephila clavipes]
MLPGQGSGLSGYRAAPGYLQYQSNAMLTKRIMLRLCQAPSADQIETADLISKEAMDLVPITRIWIMVPGVVWKMGQVCNRKGIWPEDPV